MSWEVDGPVHRALFNGFQQLMSYEAVDPDTQRTVRHPRPGWANARDVESVYKDMVSLRYDRVADEKERVPGFTLEDVTAAIQGLLRHRPQGPSLIAALRANA